MIDAFRDRFSLNSFKPVYAAHFRKVARNYPVASIKIPWLFDQPALGTPAAHF